MIERNEQISDQQTDEPTRVIGARVPVSLLDEIRGAAYWCRMSFVEIVEEALRDRLQQLRNDHNEGKPFERREAMRTRR
jgi:hypothetical protein